MPTCNCSMHNGSSVSSLAYASWSPWKVAASSRKAHYTSIPKKLGMLLTGRAIIPAISEVQHF